MLMMLSMVRFAATSNVTDKAALIATASGLLVPLGCASKPEFTAPPLWICVICKSAWPELGFRQRLQWPHERLVRNASMMVEWSGKVDAVLSPSGEL